MPVQLQEANPFADVFVTGGASGTQHDRYAGWSIARASFESRKLGTTLSSLAIFQASSTIGCGLTSTSRIPCRSSDFAQETNMPIPNDEMNSTCDMSTIVGLRRAAVKL